MQASWQQSAWATAQATPRGEEGLQYAQHRDPIDSYEGSVSMDQLRYHKEEVNLPNAPVAEGSVAGVDQAVCHHFCPSSTKMPACLSPGSLNNQILSIQRSLKPGCKPSL